MMQNGLFGVQKLVEKVSSKYIKYKYKNQILSAKFRDFFYIKSKKYFFKTKPEGHGIKNQLSKGVDLNLLNVVLVVISIGRTGVLCAISSQTQLSAD